jgi:hypothetical protein
VARTGAVYVLHELALVEDKYRQQIVQFLCSHVRSKTSETEYQKTHKERPSNEIQTTLQKIRPLTLCIPKKRPLTLSIIKIRLLTLCIPKNRPLTLCFPKICPHKVGMLKIRPRKACYFCKILCV